MCLIETAIVVSHVEVQVLAAKRLMNSPLLRDDVGHMYNLYFMLVWNVDVDDVINMHVVVAKVLLSYRNVNVLPMVHRYMSVNVVLHKFVCERRYFLHHLSHLNIKSLMDRLNMETLFQYQFHWLVHDLKYILSNLVHLHHGDFLARGINKIINMKVLMGMLLLDTWYMIVILLMRRDMNFIMVVHMDIVLKRNIVVEVDGLLRDDFAYMYKSFPFDWNVDIDDVIDMHVVAMLFLNYGNANMLPMLHRH